MLKDLKIWLHHILNPHCADCKFERDEAEIKDYELNKCESCVVLREQLQLSNSREQNLLEQIIKLSSPKEENRSEPANFPQSIHRGSSTFSARRAEMERMSRGEKNKETQILTELSDKDRINLSTEQMEAIITK
jgi:hypothetical protein